MPATTINRPCCILRDGGGAAVAQSRGNIIQSPATMTLASQLNAICDLLRTQTKLSVVVGPPNEKVRAVHVWPWRIQAAAAARNASVAPGAARLPLTPCAKFVVRSSAARP